MWFPMSHGPPMLSLPSLSTVARNSSPLFLAIHSTPLTMNLVPVTVGATRSTRTLTRRQAVRGDELAAVRLPVDSHLAGVKQRGDDEQGEEKQIAHESFSCRSVGAGGNQDSLSPPWDGGREFRYSEIRGGS